MADDDEYAYLQPSFEPSSLTVPRLRSILVAHNVAYPSAAKKADLIALFDAHVVPQARKVLAAQARTKRSTRGIVDVPSREASVAAGDDDGEGQEEEVEIREVRTPAVTPGRRSTRRSTRVASEETPRRVAGRQSGVVAHGSSKHARVEEGKEEEEDDAQPAEDVRQPKRAASRRSRVAPQDEPVYSEGPGSPFTRENPFQSGSPPAPVAGRSAERRRTTAWGASSERDRRDRMERRKSSSGPRRRTDGFKQEDGIVVPSSSTFHLDGMGNDGGDVAVGEEFTAEEQQDLIKTESESKSKSKSTAIARRPRRKAQRSGLAKAAPWTVLLAMLGGVATVWRQEKLNVGYCGVGEPSNSFGGVDIPDWAAFLQPQCEPCPQHAYCYPQLKTVCEPDFILTPHPLAAAGLVPLPPTCEPDSEKVRRIKAVADFAVESELRTRNAQYECGEASTPEISETELKETLSAKRSRRMSDQEFEELWGAAIGEVVGREEVESRVDGSSPNNTNSTTSALVPPPRRLLRSTSLARVPLACAIRRSLRLALRQHLRLLVAALSLFLLALYTRHTYRTHLSTRSLTTRLSTLALDKLAAQAAAHAADPVAYPDPWISMVALRDDVLRDEVRSGVRKRVWEAVRGRVEGNANVRTMVREGRVTGEVSRVWEWIGAVGRIEESSFGSGAGKGRSRGRIAGVDEREGEGSGTAAAGGDSSVFRSSLGGVGVGVGAVGTRKWEEGSSYY